MFRSFAAGVFGMAFSKHGPGPTSAFITSTVGTAFKQRWSEATGECKSPRSCAPAFNAFFVGALTGLIFDPLDTANFTLELVAELAGVVSAAEAFPLEVFGRLSGPPSLLAARFLHFPAGV
eukprot:CAMPEP_0197691900 /NCGR_PEP_ID=MMETSP1338-20131121/110361_1 /TAXON_ID=43686 ORGANISM="Pelagodinium beii, Strain RCC1491" /NCGR_SAMPLE_ID=MMETSP1338 /ASSEMBLY_ACC=CAM_ASM_000754 /LENGTH=120 /DNA_ID=CAMNT_0043274503 /DNA_START=238 /DNA_END=600 /DNA_ORIENTATION=-